MRSSSNGALGGGIAGMLLSCAAIVLRTLADERVRSPKELEANAKIAAFGVPTEQESGAGPAFDLLLKQLAKLYDFVLIDFPPLGLVIDAVIIAKKCDAALLVAQYAKTPLSDIAEIGGSIVLGDNVRMSAATLHSRSSISVGKDTCIGANTKIFDHDFHPVAPAQRLNHPDRGMKTAPVRIGENVFIGCNCIILKGSEIGDNCVVGAGAVVSGCFPENCIIAGNPAKIVRRLRLEPIAP